MNRRDALQAIGTAIAPLTLAGCAKQSAEATRILGIFPGSDWSRIRPFERWLERRFAVTTHYVDAAIPDQERQQFVFDAMTDQWNGGRVPIVTWQPFPRSDDENENVTREIAAGAYDDILSAWARDLGEWLSGENERRSVYFRPFPEMNGDWVPWGADSTTIDDFVTAWRRVYETMGDAGLADERVQWMWNPNATEHGDHETESYYPGDEYVDWIGLDGYNFGDSQQHSSWQSPNEVFEPMLERLTALADKPLSLPEFGSSSYRDGEYRPAEKARWIDDAFDLIEQYDVRMVCWFNIDKETDWAVFGGGRGTDTYSADDRSETYDVYETYRDRCTTAAYRVGDDDTHLSSAAFQGQL